MPAQRFILLGVVGVWHPHLIREGPCQQGLGVVVVGMVMEEEVCMIDRGQLRHLRRLEWGVCHLHHNYPQVTESPISRKPPYNSILYNS